MAHTSAEKSLIDWEDRIVIPWLNMSRAVGDFALDFHSSYLQYLPGDQPYSGYNSKILTPPYIISEPSVRFIDLQPMWGKTSKLVLFTDGVDNLVDGYMVFKPGEHTAADPLRVVGELLADIVDPAVEKTLGHKIIPCWSRCEDNRATDVMGNLLGADLDRLEMVTDLNLLTNANGWPFRVHHRVASTRCYMRHVNRRAAQTMAPCSTSSVSEFVRLPEGR
ncbi:hypothetical protein BN946_scf184945.g69 [Trametes cinnabarina]|uniref:Uncharacterized protein n=1 Tax=Pycnoporus cinnabarinus TaxID=5643 RepID=A0A060SKF5_PYCCI|nr:hypothetical protein BN946_scf184945.g69 [Trametes cinnabarina]